MPKLRAIATVDLTDQPCFRCKERDRETPATHTVYYDDSMGAFDPDRPPRLCQPHADELRELTKDQRHEILKDFPLRPDEPEIDMARMGTAATGKN